LPAGPAARPAGRTSAIAAEWLATLSAAGELGNGAAVETVVAASQHTAEAYADPELFARLTRDHGDADHGAVPPPEVPE
jgi:hypothetical protein